MAAPWIAFLDGLKDEAGSVAKGELKGLITDSLTDGEEFIRRQAGKVERYLNQIALGEITTEEFKGYMVDIEELTRMQVLKLQVAAKARAQRLADGIQSLIIDKLIALIP